ncbi:PAS domain-containing sensor histidine kinase [Phormidesmis priestleyi ULC007]|uniref:histidine kinase n=1 Tax=Phormidesmis priestleyi ULC007 TaxID=1920490 RepID=A0A2T1D5K6_9CYAN|nr:PAS domain-containing sensor histidine kinase [Phormidesmis priestleyi]PSB15737.1 PAS domain-containing sensor histidine kinase [Phormidesmis priestleyi ULC007]PZO46421.1 MAG: PAS domain-containing sensor histidine kinase [Phormidesmis priestleyi]
MQNDTFTQKIRISLDRLLELGLSANACSEQEALLEHLQFHATAIADLQALVVRLQAQNQELRSERNALNLEKNHYQDLFEFAPDAYFVTSIDGVIIEANQTTERLFRVERSWLAGSPLLRFIASEARSEFATYLTQFDSGKLVGRREVGIQPAQGKAFPAVFKVVAVQNGHGQTVALRWMVRDIIERKHTETTIRQQNADLESEIQEQTAQLEQALDYQAMLRRITDRIRDSLDENQILQTVVQELGLVLNLTACDTALYDAAIEVTILYKWLAETRELRNPGQPEVQTVPISAYLPVAEASMFPALSTLLAQRSQGKPSQFCELETDDRAAILLCPIVDNQGVLGDLFLYRQSQNAFSQLEVALVHQVASQCAIAVRQARLYQTAQIQVKELAHLNQIKDEFLSTVSYELRTPMANMKMAAQMLNVTLKQTGNQDTKADRYLEILQNECDREAKLIEDLLDLQQLDTNTMSLLLSAIPVEEWLHYVANPLLKRFEKHQQTLKFDVGPNLPALVCDQLSLSRIVVELLTNACKYTPNYESVILSANTIINTVHTEPQIVRIMVCNTGVEIPGDKISNIFDKFYRIPELDFRKEGGTGLGLALVQKLVDRVGGTIRVESGNLRTCFMVELPL